MNKIDEYMSLLPEWQKANLEQFRNLLHEVTPSINEDFKWNVPVFLINGKVVFAMAAFKAHTKYNFIANGALIDDSMKLFNNGFDSKKSRSIDLHEGDTLSTNSLKSLIKSAADNLTS